LDGLKKHVNLVFHNSKFIFDGEELILPFHMSKINNIINQITSLTSPILAIRVILIPEELTLWSVFL